MSELLIKKGYLSISVWEGQSPEYYIEVKTRPASLDGLFYCSQLQVNRMKEMNLTESRPSDEVYRIARVFSLGDSEMGIKLYLDQETLRTNNQ